MSTTCKYALITGTVVQNLIISDSAYAAILSSQYDYVIDYTIYNGVIDIGYIYDNNTGLFAAPLPTLPIAKQNNLLAFKAAIQAWIQGQYDPQTQQQFLCMYIAAQSGGLTDRQAYIGQILTWLNSVESYAASYMVAIQSMSSAAQVVVTMWDFSQIVIANPNITLSHAISIIT